MFKYLGQHIFDFVSKFRNDVYFQNLEELDQNFSIVVGPDGKLSKSKSPAEKSIIEVRNDEGSVIPAGAPLYSKGEIGGSDRIKVGICDASDPAKMPCIGIAQVEMNTSDTKDNFAITQGVYNTNISGFTGLSEGDTLYVNGGSAPYLVSTKPSNGNYIQNVGIVLKTNGTICQGLLVSAIGRTNDVPWPLYVDVPNSRVGIGTTTPSTKFHVDGNIRVGDVNDVIYTNKLHGLSIGDLTLYTSGNTLLTQTGNVGIGTTSPTEKLHVRGGNIRIDSNDSRGQYLQFRNNGIPNALLSNTFNISGGSSFTDFNTYVYGNNPYSIWTNNVNRLTVSGTGNVGIGTTSPVGILHAYSTSAPVIESPSNAAIIIRRNDNVGYSSLLKYHSGNSEKFVAGLSDSGDFTNSTGEEYFIGTTKTNPLVVLKNDGKLGIGTTSPSQKLHVEGTSLFVGQGTWPMRMENNVASGQAELALWTVTDAYAQSETFSLVATPRPNISSRPIWYFQAAGDGWRDMTLQRYGGQVGIRTLEPSANLTVQGGGTTTGKTFLAQDSNASALFTILDNGNVGIGTTSPSEKLHVGGNAKVQGNIYLNDATERYIYGYNNLSYIKFYDPSYGGMLLHTHPNHTLRVETNLLEVTGGFSTGGNFTMNGDLSIGNGNKVQSSSGNNYIHLYRGSDASMVFKITHPTVGHYIWLDKDDNELVRFTRDGNVGIGTTLPSEKLEVSGNIKASGTIKGKMEQMFACSFSDDLGTTKHYLSFTSNAEQTNVHADQAAMVMPYNGRVKSIQMRLSNIDADTIRTFGIETIAPGINMYAASNNWTIEETESYELAATDDFYLVNYVFSNTSHFESGDLLAISIQDAEDAYTASRQTYITVIIEYDLNNGMGNDTATTKYTS